MSAWDKGRAIAVRRAAKMMDKRLPGWYRRIVFKRLNMGDACNCIAGQTGLDWTELEDAFERRYRDSRYAPFADGEDEWIEEVRARRRAAS